MTAVGDPVEIRRLGPNDLPLVRSLNEMFAEAFDEPDVYRGDPPADRYLAEVVAKEDVFVLVAMHGDEVVGGLVAYELAKLERVRSELYVYDLAVAERWRRRGIATALLECLRALGAERDAWVLFVQADRDDAPAAALYEKLGRREEVLHFDVPIRRETR